MPKRGGSSGIAGAVGAPQNFEEFTDVAISGFTYSGDDQNVRDFFAQNSNITDIENDLTDNEDSALRLWTAGMLMSAVQYRGWDNMFDISPSSAAVTQVLDDLIDKSRLDKGVVVTRLSTPQLITGTKTASLAELQAAEGSIIYAAGNMSCSAAAEGLSIGSGVGVKAGGSKTVEYRIKIPPSTGAGLYIGTSTLNPSFDSSQREFITSRDIYLRVGKSSYNAKRDIYVTELEYVRKGTHDYGTKGRMPKKQIDANL